MFDAKFLNNIFFLKFFLKRNLLSKITSEANMKFGF